MTKTEAIAYLDALHHAVERADSMSVASLGLEPMDTVSDSVIATDGIAHAERQVKARVGYLDRAIRSNGTAPPTTDIEKLRRRAGRAIVALRDVLETADPGTAGA
jgi:2-keto-4-pentenoate hydratase